jgi:hypothetical protein
MCGEVKLMGLPCVVWWIKMAVNQNCHRTSGESPVSLRRYRCWYQITDWRMVRSGKDCDLPVLQVVTLSGV